MYYPLVMFYMMMPNFSTAFWFQTKCKCKERLCEVNEEQHKVANEDATDYTRV